MCLSAIIAREYLATVKSSPEYGDAVFDIINRHRGGKTRTGRPW